MTPSRFWSPTSRPLSNRGCRKSSRIDSVKTRVTSLWRRYPMPLTGMRRCSKTGEGEESRRQRLPLPAYGRPRRHCKTDSDALAAQTLHAHAYVASRFNRL